MMRAWGTGLTAKIGLGDRLDEILFLDEQLECQSFSFSFSFVNTKHLPRRNVDLSGISVIEMPIQPTFGIMSTRHDISGARLLTPLWMGTIITRVIIVIMRTE